MAGKLRNADLQEIQKSIWDFIQPGRVVGRRAPHKSGCGSGYFDDHEKLASTIKRLSDDGGYQAVYVSINVINADVLPGRVAKYIFDTVTRTTKKSDIARRCHLLIDIDPKRPAGVSATKEEKAKAYALMVEVVKALKAMGLPSPVVATSGNGYHLLYRVDEPNNPSVDKLFKSVLNSLAQEFSTDAVGIDTAVHDAARVTKAYGTTGTQGTEHTGASTSLLQDTIRSPKCGYGKPCPT